MSRNVMLIDDDQVVIFLHQVIMRESGLSEEPVVAFNGREALEHILKKHSAEEEYLMFLDINMPEMNAWDLLDELQKKKLDKATKVIIVSSSVDHEDKKRSKRYPNVMDYVEKPLDVEYCSRFFNV